MTASRRQEKGDGVKKRAENDGRDAPLAARENLRIQSQQQWPAASTQQIGLVITMGTTFWMSAEIQRDVSLQYTAALNEMEPAINAVLENSDYGPLTRWSFIAIVRENDDPDYGEVKRYHKKKRVFEFRLKIDHATFKTADDLGKRKLIMAELLRSIDEMCKLVPKGIDYARLEQDVRGVAAAKGWL